MNVAVVACAATVIETGTVAAEGVSLERATTAPPGGALPVSVTVPVELVPPETLVGDSDREEMAAGLTVRLADLCTLR